MSPAFSRKVTTPFNRYLQSLARIIFILPAIVLSVLAVYLVVHSTLENRRIVELLDQVYTLNTQLQEFSNSADAFARQPGQDVLANLTHLGKLVADLSTKPAALKNPWKGALTGIIVAPYAVRYETSIPNQVCRRLILEQTLSPLSNLMAIEIGSGDGHFSSVYRKKDDLMITDEALLNTCLMYPTMTVALVFDIH